MKLELDYVRSSVFPQPLRWFLILLAVVLLVWQGWQTHLLQQELHGLQWRVNEQNRQVRKAPRQTPAQHQDIDSRIREANLQLQALGLPWNLLFDRLEQAASPQIALLEIQPQADKGRIALIGQARSMEALLAYVRALEALDVLHDVSIQEHVVLTEEHKATTTTSSVAFHVQSRWKTRL